MKFKLEENLPFELAKDLQEPGYDADTVNDEGLGEAGPILSADIGPASSAMI